MQRKGLWLALLLLAVAGLVAAMGWVEDQRAVDSEVGWSPLYERRVTDALVPVTSQEARGAAQASFGFYTCACATAFDLPCNEPEEPDALRTSAAVTCDENPECQGPPDQTAGEDLYDLFTYEGPTCAGMSTCDQSTCYCPTLTGPTCTRPTCDGPTCGGPTCEGDTCFLARCEVTDYGDAAGIEYLTRTRRKYDGARHVIDGVYFLGTREDPEWDGQPTDLADGDDGEAYGKGDDEDGVWFPTTLNRDAKATVIVRVSQPGSLFAWVDYAGDESWGYGEAPDRVFANGVPVRPAYNWVVVNVPAQASYTARSFARFRYVESGKAEVGGRVETGEVEDYSVVLAGTFRAWVMTDKIRYAPGEPVRIATYLNETSQVTVIVHRPDGTQKALLATTAEVGRHVFPEDEDGFPAELPLGTCTVEVIATSLKSGITAWLTTPYDVSE